jgi:hypothetical protein|tara:strand:- start:116 stop:358 length:243 start_codon:yes stop_codon:yes gene_type:complete
MVSYASFIGQDPTISSNEFVVKTQHEMGTIQSVFNQEKICKLFGTTKEKFVYFSCIDYTDCISQKITGKRYYVVIKCSDV